MRGTARPRRPTGRSAAPRRDRHPDGAFSAASCRRVAGGGRLGDGNDLYLEVERTGARRWIQRLALRGKSRTLGLRGLSSRAPRRVSWRLPSANWPGPAAGGVTANHRERNMPIFGGGRRPETEAAVGATRKAREGPASKPAAPDVPAARREGGLCGRQPTRVSAGCCRARGTERICPQVDRKRLGPPVASSGHQRARVLAVVKAPRCARPPLRGADGLDDGSAHARPDWLLSVDAQSRSPRCCGRRSVSLRRLSDER